MGWYTGKVLVPKNSLGSKCVVIYRGRFLDVGSVCKDVEPDRQIFDLLHANPPTAPVKTTSKLQTLNLGFAESR